MREVLQARTEGSAVSAVASNSAGTLAVLVTEGGDMLTLDVNTMALEADIQRTLGPISLDDEVRCPEVSSQSHLGWQSIPSILLGLAKSRFIARFYRSLGSQ